MHSVSTGTGTPVWRLHQELDVPPDAAASAGCTWRPGSLEALPGGTPSVLSIFDEGISLNDLCWRPEL